MHQFKCVVACECVVNIANGCPYIAPAGGNRGGKGRARCCRRRRVSERVDVQRSYGTESASSDRTNMYKADGRPYGLCCDRERSPELPPSGHTRSTSQRKEPPSSADKTTSGITPIYGKASLTHSHSSQSTPHRLSEIGETQ